MTTFVVSPAPPGNVVDPSGNTSLPWEVWFRQVVYRQISSPSFNGPISINSVQLLTAQQAGMGATLGAYTLSGTYATDLVNLQWLYNKVILLETKLKAHGLIAT